MSKLRFVQGPMPDRIAGLNNIVQSVRVVYETDPAVVRAMLPKPLVAAERPEVFLQFAKVDARLQRGQLLYEPGGGQCSIGLGQRCAGVAEGGLVEELGAG